MTKTESEFQYLMKDFTKKKKDKPPKDEPVLQLVDPNSSVSTLKYVSSIDKGLQSVTDQPMKIQCKVLDAAVIQDEVLPSSICFTC
ncbi:hypothetical protein ACFX12_025623 [Malus domestica]